MPPASPRKTRPIGIPAIRHLVYEQIGHKPMDIVTSSHSEQGTAAHLCGLHRAEIILLIKQDSQPSIDDNSLLKAKL